MPSEIGHMKQLVHLSLANNTLSTLPESIGLLTQLTTLKLNNNYLNKLPGSIGLLTKLQLLNVGSNVLKEIPVEIGQGCKALMVVDFGQNTGLRCLPAEMVGLKLLKRIGIEGCGLMTNFEDCVKEERVVRLVEVCARVIVRERVPVLYITSDRIKAYIQSYKLCAYCKGKT